MDEPAIRVHGLGKMYKLYPSPLQKALDVFGVNRLLFWRQGRYQQFWALRGMSLEVPRGQRLGIIGSNGAGKSTLLKVIAGNTPATEGTVEVHGTIQSLMVLGVGFHPEFTGRENIRAALGLQGFSGPEIAEREQEIVTFSELDLFIDQPIRTYSAGMYARLAFSTATAMAPDILIVDEILGAGDAYFAGKSLQRMRRLTDDSGATALLVSHDLNSILAFSERVIWIDRGQIQADGNPVDVCKAYYKHQQDRENKRGSAPAGAVNVPVSGSIITDHVPDTRIETVRFLDRHGNEITGLEEGEPLVVEIRYFSEQRVVRPEFAMSFFTMDGRRLCHANTALAGARIEQIAGTGAVRFHFEAFPACAGEYLLSASIFHYLDLTSAVQAPYYDQHDRAYRLRVWSRLGLALDLGLVRADCTVEHQAAGASRAA